MIVFSLFTSVFSLPAALTYVFSLLGLLNPLFCNLNIFLFFSPPTPSRALQLVGFLLVPQLFRYLVAGKIGQTPCKSM